MLREFKDKSGVSWQVWDVYPASPKTTPQSSEALSHFPTHGLSDGWLCFQCDNEKRRLTPIPPKWEVCKGEELEELCNQAGYVSKAQ